MEALIFDSHAHYTDGRFDADRAELLGSALPARNVGCILNMGADLESCYGTVALTEQYGYIYGAVGIHPEDAAEDQLPPDWLSRIEELLSRPKIVAVGEIGLDYHWLDSCPKDRQQEVFAAQLELANRLSLPVSVHDREAHADTLSFLQKYRPRGVLHCFSGSWEMAREVLFLGLYLGFGGTVTFKNARHAPEVVKKMPLDRLLLETDAPYLAPEPFRGQRNDSSLILHVAERIAQLREESVETILNAAAANAKRLFFPEEQS